MIPVFPDYVDIQANTYNEEFTSSVIRSEFDSGFAKQRTQFCKGFKIISFEIKICNDNYQNFLDWWRNDIKRGAYWFHFTDPQTETVRRARFTEFNLSLIPNDKYLRSWRTTVILEIFDNA